jgi:hypothetical protein
VPVPSWSVPAGRVLGLQGQGWRIVLAQARRLRAEVSEPAFRRALAAEPDTPCHGLGESLPPVAGWRLRMLDAGPLCLAVYRARSEGASAGAAAGAQPSDELGVWVYPRPTAAMLSRLAQRPLLPIAAVSPYARVSRTLPDEPYWALGVEGEFAGWLALRTRDGPEGLPGEEGSATGAQSFIGLPLTTCALWRFGTALLPPGRAGGKAEAITSASSTTSTTPATSASSAAPAAPAALAVRGNRAATPVEPRGEATCRDQP